MTKDSTLIPAIEPISRTPALVDILIQIEDVLDSLDIYAYDNWIEGSLAYGPFLRRHWIELGFFYPHKKMPDPYGSKRLIKYGIRVNFKKIKVPVVMENGEINPSPGVGTIYDMNNNVPPPPELPIRMDPIKFGIKGMETVKAPIVNYNSNLDVGSVKKKTSYKHGWIVSLAIPQRLIEQRFVSALTILDQNNKDSSEDLPVNDNMNMEMPDEQPPV